MFNPFSLILSWNSRKWNVRMTACIFTICMHIFMLHLEIHDSRVKRPKRLQKFPASELYEICAYLHAYFFNIMSSFRRIVVPHNVTSSSRLWNRGLFSALFLWKTTPVAKRRLQNNDEMIYNSLWKIYMCPDIFTCVIISSGDAKWWPGVQR